MTTTNTSDLNIIRSESKDDTLFTIKKSIQEYLLIPSGLFGFFSILSMAVFSKLIFYNSYLSIKFLPINLGEIRYWVYGITILMMINFIIQIHSYFKSNIAFEIKENDIILDGKSYNISRIYSIRTTKEVINNKAELSLELAYKAEDFETNSKCSIHTMEYIKFNKTDFNNNLKNIIKYCEKSGIIIDLISI
jgi:hypothetical protein